jgi:signal transduction histidine kinase
LLPESIAVRLTRRLITRDASTGPGGSGREPNAPAFSCLAQVCAPLAAWLMDHLTEGARQSLLDGAGVGGAHGSFELDSRLASLSHGELLERLAESLEFCHVAPPQQDAWRAAEARSRAVAERAAALAGSEASLKRSREIRWWALYLTSPVGALDPAADGGWTWTLLPPASLHETLAQDHWLTAHLDCVRRAQSEVNDPLASPEEDEPPPCAADGDGWPMLLQDVLQLARRHALLKREFQEAVEREKLLAMKELAYGASHEINNPLANISSRAQLLLREESDPERRRSLATINSQAFRAHEMIADMMLFAKPPALQCEAIDLEKFLQQWLDRLAAELPATVSFERTLALGPTVCRCDPAQIAEVLRAIWSNALEAMGDEGQMRFSAHLLSRGAGPRWAELTLVDSGPGISPEVRRRLFDPFFSGREAGRGLGFGLSKAWRIVDLHGGQITIDSPPGSGAVLTVRLPVEE